MGAVLVCVLLITRLYVHALCLSFVLSGGWRWQRWSLFEDDDNFETRRNLYALQNSQKRLPQVVVPLQQTLWEGYHNQWTEDSERMRGQRADSMVMKAFRQTPVNYQGRNILGVLLWW